MKKVLKIQPEFYDVYFGIGSYKYWRSRVTRYINWLPLVPDERETGMNMVQKAIEKGKFTRYAAMNELTWILLDAGRPDEAYTCALVGLEKFPQSRFFLWGAAKSAYALQDFEAAANYFQELLISITSSQPNNFYNEYICRLNLVRSFIEIKNYPGAKHQIKNLDSLTLSPEIYKKLKKQRRQFEQLKKQLETFADADQPADSLISEDNFTDEQRRQKTSEITN